MNHRSQNDSAKEQRDVERRFREKELETQRYHLDDGRKYRAHYEFDKLSRRHEEELKWGKGFIPDRWKKGAQDSGAPVEEAERPGSELKSAGGPAPRKEHVGNKVLSCIFDNLLFISAYKTTNCTSTGL